MKITHHNYIVVRNDTDAKYADDNYEVTGGVSTKKQALELLAYVKEVTPHGNYSIYVKEGKPSRKKPIIKQYP